MAQKESTLINMLLTLFVVTLVAGAALGFVYTSTKDTVEKTLEGKTIKAVEMVLPKFDNNPKSEMYKHTFDEKLPEFEIYPARNENNELIGVAIKTATNQGYSGLIQIMVGITIEGKIHKTFLLAHKETPGLGTKLAESPFKDQFEGKSPDDLTLEVEKDGGDVDAITAATISSRAFCDALKNAYEVFNKIDKETGMLK